MIPIPVLKPLSALLIKPTGADCNIDCAYCFYLDRAGIPRPGFDPARGAGRQQGRRMTDEVQDSLIRQAMRGGSREISFGWQGGEPTMMGLEFFERTISLQRQYGSRGQVVGNGLQTNGLLIDEPWCDFLRETNWLVGLSIDGPESVHDHYRVTRNGKPTYAQVRAAAQLMNRKGVQYNALTVVTDHSARFAREIYDHHKTLGTHHMQFIPCVERDPNDPAKAASFSVSAEDYGRFLCEIFDCWKSDFAEGRPTTSIRWFDSVFYTYVRLPPPECTLLSECGNYVVVEYNGDVFSCDFFVEESWKLGNVLTGSLIEMLNSPKQKEFGELKGIMPRECYTCNYEPHCHGGCTKDRLRDPADMGSNHFCKSFIQFFDHAGRELERLAAEWKREQRILAEREAMLGRIAGTAAPRRVLAANRMPPLNAPCPCGSGKKFKRCCGRKQS